MPAPVSRNIVCLRYRSDDPDAFNAALVADPQQSGVAVVNLRTSRHDMDAMLAKLESLAAARARGARSPSPGLACANCPS